RTRAACALRPDGAPRRVAAPGAGPGGAAAAVPARRGRRAARLRRAAARIRYTAPPWAVPYPAGMPQTLVVPFTSGFGSAGREGGPAALASLLGGKQRVIDMTTGRPVDQELAEGLPQVASAVADSERPVP